MLWGNTWLLVVVVVKHLLLVVVVVKHLPGCGGCKEYWLFLVVVVKAC